MKCYRFFVGLLMLLLMYSLSGANLHAQEGGEEYIVRSGDTLSGLAARFLDYAGAWISIWEETNAKAQNDESFAVISNPDFIRVGQKLWIPAANDEAAENEATAEESASPSSEMSEEELKQAYMEAVQDAAIVEPDEISTDLVAIVPFNSELVWEGEPGESRLLAVTWTSWDGYDDKVGESMTLTQEIWVTTVPEVQEFCQAYEHKADTLTLRLEQFLGLPPNNGKTKFVEVWVEPADIFRPSPDPEVTDTVAEEDFPQSRFFVVSQEHVQWVTDLQSESYGEQGYPWTRLGYTYDWGNPESEVGASEFVVVEGATIGVEAVTETNDYCQP